MKKITTALFIIITFALCVLPGRAFDRAGYPKRTFRAVQKAKARNFLDRLAQGPVDYTKNASKEMKEKKEKIEKELLKTRNEKLYPKEGARRPNTEGFPAMEMQKFYARLKDAILTMKINNPAPVTESARFPEIYKLQKEIPDDGIVLEYYLGRGRSYLFAVTRTSFWSYNLETDRDRLEKAVKSYAKTIQARPKTEVLKARGKSLYIMLGMDRLGVELKEKRLIIVAPHGVLHRLPFHTLTAPDGKMLIETHRVLTAPSATAYYDMKRHSSRTKATAESALFSIEIPPKNPGINYQPDTHFLKINMKPGRTFMNADFTADAFMKTAPGAKTLHVEDPFSYVNVQYPLFSQFFAWREPVYFRQIQVTRFKNRLAVLNFPGSADGFRTPGDDVSSFARAFLTSGADTVLAVLGKDTVKFSHGFWKEFYRVINNGDAPSYAFQKAVLESMKKDSVAVWGRYVLMGIE